MVQRKAVLVPPLAVLLVAWTSSAWANSISPALGLWPGVFIASPLFGLPATLLAAFLERPFISHAGVHHYALRYSIRANLISWLVGAACFQFLYGITIELLLLIYHFAAIFLSIWIEASYLWQVTRKLGSRLRRGPIIAANIFSAIVLVLLGVLAADLAHRDPMLAWRLRPYTEQLETVSGVLCGVIVAYGLWPRRCKGTSQPRPPQEAQPGVEPRSEERVPAAL